MDNNLKAELTKEATRRLDVLSKKYNLNPIILEDYKKDGTIYYSEDIILGKKARIEKLSTNTYYLEIIKKFEEENNAIVYHAISAPKELLGKLSCLGGGLNILYIAKGRNKNSNYFDNLLRYDRVDSYVYNIDREDFSEFGEICLLGVNGALSRKDIQNMLADPGMSLLFGGF